MISRVIRLKIISRKDFFCTVNLDINVVRRRWPFSYKKTSLNCADNFSRLLTSETNIKLHFWRFFNAIQYFDYSFSSCVLEGLKLSEKLIIFPLRGTLCWIYSIIIIATIVGIPHYFTETMSLEILDGKYVEYLFYIFNDLSVVYIIIPFFVIELKVNSRGATIKVLFPKIFSQWITLFFLLVVALLLSTAFDIFFNKNNLIINIEYIIWRKNDVYSDNFTFATIRSLDTLTSLKNNYYVYIEQLLLINWAKYCQLESSNITVLKN